jgi:peptidoglycan lytic transglycosylase G
MRMASGYPRPPMDEERTPDRSDPTTKHHPRRTSLVIVLALFVLVASGLAWGANYYRSCKEAPEASGTTVSFEVPDGATGADVVQSLADRGLISCGGFVGNLLLRGTGRASDIRAGTYELTMGMSLGEIIGVLTTPPPKVPTVRLTVPPGLRIRSMYKGERSIASEVAEQTGLSAERVADLAESGRYSLPPYLRKGTPTAEGFLYPETYQLVKKGLTENAVIRRMLQQFETVAGGLPWDNAKRLGVTPYEVVIIASMIEKEAGANDDWGLIAGVIYNRLRIGMNLGIDATLLYDDPTPDGALSTPDLETRNPYNTRLTPGLPPTPIASPGRRSLSAALAPAHTPYLYYVLCPPDGDGVHRFSKTLHEHIVNVHECLG